jgi:multiple antibiotic resistance protein
MARQYRDLASRLGTFQSDAATPIVGFFVSAIGMGLIFHGVVEFLQSYGIVGGKIASIF